MKIAAVILAIAGIGNLLGVIPLFSAERWLEAVLALAIGCLALPVALGILRRNRFAWPLGFYFIGACALYSIVSIVPFTSESRGIPRAALMVFCFVGALGVSAFWGVVWHRQCAYFFPGEPKA
jgi:hypothetical protein